MEAEATEYWQWMRLNNETDSDTYHFNFENLLGINSSVLIKYLNVLWYI